jgi:hypothetical protein
MASPAPVSKRAQPNCRKSGNFGGHQPTGIAPKHGLSSLDTLKQAAQARRQAIAARAMGQAMRRGFRLAGNGKSRGNPPLSGVYPKHGMSDSQHTSHPLKEAGQGEPRW